MQERDVPMKGAEVIRMELKFLKALMLGSILFSGCPAVAEDVTSGVVQLKNASLEYFSRGEGEAVVLLPGGTLTVGYLDAFADALAA